MLHRAQLTNREDRLHVSSATGLLHLFDLVKNALPVALMRLNRVLVNQGFNQLPLLT